MSSLSIRSVCKSFGKVGILENIDLDVEDGEFVVLVGPSGCGKSTLLRCISGLEAVSSGEIRVDDKSVEKVPTRDRNMSMVFQSYALFPHLTVAENIAFGLKLRRTGRERIETLVGEVADLLGLSGYLDRYPRQLSGGQRQRVAMGRAIVRQPCLFLFDEPLSNLDAKLRIQMRTEIKSLRQRLGITSIYVTHDQDEAMTLADRIVVMNAGRIEQVGSPMDLYDHPKNLFVAGFLGSPTMNFIPLFRQADGGTFETAGGQRVALNILRPIGEDSVVLGVRPESLAIRNDGEFAGVVEVVEPRGSETLVFVKIDDETMLCVSAEKRARFRPGDMARIGFTSDELHVFSKSNGQSLMANSEE